MSPTRRDIIKATTGIALVASGASTAAESLPASDFAAVLAWETAREVAEERGEAWVADAGSLAVVLEVATTQAEKDGLALAEDVAALRVQATMEHTHRRSMFTSWAVKAWDLKPVSPLPPLPAEPWKD